VREHLDELGRLVDTAGAVIVGELTQQIDRPNPATFLGTGKLEELKAKVEETGASLIVFDEELTPTQGKNIEDLTGRRVMDRAEVILDIFATRARSAEAKMQVELAQLEYMLPRLKRMWAHLERVRGGIGMRGPGEMQIETDRRLINARIRTLKLRLQDVEKSRQVQRAGRRALFRVALVGYTNAGKSSILRALSRSPEVFVEDRLFATLDPLTREVYLDDGGSALVSDTVGFIRKLPHHLVASFRATLAEMRESDLLLHVIDSSHPRWEEQRSVVDVVLGELGIHDKRIIDVFNKVDRLSDDGLGALRDWARDALPGSVFVSAVNEAGVEPLRRALLAASRGDRSLVEIRLPASAGPLRAEIHRDADVVEERAEGDEWVVWARVSAAVAGRLRDRGAKVAG
jgi:GTP-binding protein HflX